jgi:allophanate hydrolase subunit 2
VRLPVDQRFKGGEVRAMPGPQTGLFSDDTRARFAGAEFRRDPRGNRQGVRLNHEGAGFAIDGGLSILSDLIVPGDIQMTGEGVPYVLLAECQTIGGYPRMGTVLPADLPRVAQCPPGGVLRIRMVSPEEAERSVQPPEAILRGLKGRVEPVLRNPHDIADLLAYQLVGGVTAGDELDQDEEQPR